MWLCFNDGFLSVVADKHDPSRLLVRARRRQDLLNAVGKETEIVETPDRDYRWRTFIGREDFTAIVGGRIDKIDYTNFKNSVKDHDLHDMYLDFWARHLRYQDQGRPVRRFDCSS